MIGHDLLMFGLGTNFGIYLILILQATAQYLNERRDRAALAAATAQLDDRQDAIATARRDVGLPDEENPR